ncbi:MAG TPA: signal peptidase II, partial [Candidatus Nanoarchaeia archaeon]|nr:signal peptidase II [Candidatus Nanoarchaeia archaeon]
MVKKSFLFWIVSAGIIILDQLSKLLIDYVQPQSPFIHLVQNTGAGFGILKGQTLWLALISLIVAVAVIVNYKKIPPQTFPQVLWGLFLGGVVGNLIDRVLRGYVIDFIDLQVWPTFNVADAAITASV